LGGESLDPEPQKGRGIYTYGSNLFHHNLYIDLLYRYIMSNTVEYTGETTELSIFPSGKAGAKLVYQLSQNIRPEHQERYISIGVLSLAYPDKTGREIEELVKEFEKKEERPELVITEITKK